jgi:hypothetical protein
VREGAGLFAKPIEKPAFTADVRLGFGAWETRVRDGFAVKGVTDGYLELQQMEDSAEIGAELQIKLSGKHKELITYGARAEFMYPFWDNSTSGLEGGDLLNMEFELLFGVKLAKWISLDYAFKAQKFPLIIDEWQISNNLLLTLTAAKSWQRQ